MYQTCWRCQEAAASSKQVAYCGAQIFNLAYWGTTIWLTAEEHASAKQVRWLSGAVNWSDNSNASWIICGAALQRQRELRAGPRRCPSYSGGRRCPPRGKNNRKMASKPGKVSARANQEARKASQQAASKASHHGSRQIDDSKNQQSREQAKQARKEASKKQGSIKQQQHAQQ